MTRITNIPALHTLQDETMVYAAITCAVAVGVAFLAANMVAWRGGQDKSYVTRRIWFCVIGLVFAAGFYMYNDLVVKPEITNVGWQNMFSNTNLTCLGIIVAGYIIVSVILMFCFRHSKFGSILGKEKNK